jgi:hypothetical protein
MCKRSNECLNEVGKLPKVYAPIRIIAFEYKVHKHGILTPPKSFKTPKTCKRA